MLLEQLGEATIDGTRKQYMASVSTVALLVIDDFGICSSSPPQVGLSRVSDVASSVENVSAAYSATTVAPHEYFDQTG